MKYLVVEMINTYIDACSHHESCIATCSDGGDTMGAPWIFVRSGLLDSRNDAEKLVGELYLERCNELVEKIDKKSGWNVAVSHGDIDGVEMCFGTPSDTLYIYKDLSEDEFTSEWLYEFKILEVE